MGMSTFFFKKKVEHVHQNARSYSIKTEKGFRNDKRDAVTTRSETCAVCEYPTVEENTSMKINLNNSTSEKNEHQQIAIIDSKSDIHASHQELIQKKFIYFSFLHPLILRRHRQRSSRNTTSYDADHVNYATSGDDRMKINLNLAHYISDMTQTLVYIPFCLIIVSTLIFNFCCLATVTSTLGDGKRSPESSYTFFQSVDRDGDGVLKAEEVAYFLEDHIGGASFDTSSEVNDEVFSLMKDLDRDHEEGLDKGDVFAYWNNLESLLTVDEVKEWVENALQLPEYIGE